MIKPLTLTQELAQGLIAHPSVTPHDGGIQNLISNRLVFKYSGFSYGYSPNHSKNLDHWKSRHFVLISNGFW